MIINVGGRTDIVNYYSQWFYNRLKEGYVYTRNPYNKKQITFYDLSSNKIDALIFCSKNYEPILKYMPEINNKYPLFCYYTITSYQKDVEPKVPSIDKSIEILKNLSNIVGSKKVSWRFDPILLTDKYTIDYHLETFDYICSKLSQYISFCIFSFVDMYNKVYKNMPEIIEINSEEKEELLTGLSKIAKKHNIILQSCAVGNEYAKYGIRDSGCVTTEILENSNDILFKKVKHKGSRVGCKCMPWRDIGEYDTCINGCKYCYANRNPQIAKLKYKQHNPNSPILIGEIKDTDKINKAKQVSFLRKDNKQTKLF